MLAKAESQVEVDGATDLALLLSHTVILNCGEPFDPETPLSEEIRVHQKALGHLTRGLYRSPASAIRELVSNAWDANATEVHIDTRQPMFDRFQIRDNGDGFNKEHFRRLMGAFGNSEKRPNDTALINGRPIIGRLGIGLLGIAQICGSFTIKSRPRKGSGFAAKLTLPDQYRSALDRDESALVDRSTKGVETVVIGIFEMLPDEEWKELPFGTLIETDDLISTFAHAFRATYSFITDSARSSKRSSDAKSRKPLPFPTDWTTFVARASRAASLDEIGDYWRWLWELAALSPVAYMSEDSLPSKVVAEQNRRLSGYKFAVSVDGFALRKPVALKANVGGYTVQQIPLTTLRAHQRDIVFSGYIVVQSGRQIRPPDLRGILVRIRDVGVGLYDASLLDYPFNEGPRSHWLTGEIFVTDGLEDSLNVDRDSFNRYAPPFQVLRRRIHQILREEVFPDVYKKIDRRTKATVARRDAERIEAVQTAAQDFTDKALSITTVGPESRSQPEGGLSVSVNPTTIRVRISAAGIDGVSRGSRRQVEPILMLYDIAQAERTPEARRKLFLNLLVKFFKS